VNINGVMVQQKKGETVHVADFDFFVSLLGPDSYDIHLTWQIDLTDILSPTGVHLSVVPDSMPAYRGKMCAAYGASASRIQHQGQGGQDGYAPLSMEDSSSHSSVASGQPIAWGAHQIFDQWRGKRWIQGFPVWAKLSEVPMEGIHVLGDTSDVERIGGAELDQPTLRAWCEAYCADKG
jgi:hypothetical protein